MVEASEDEASVVLELLRRLGQPGAGLSTIYGVLDYLVEHFELQDAELVVESELTGPQIFRAGHRPLGAGRSSELLAKGPGLYTTPDSLEPSLREVVLALAPAAISLQANHRPSNEDGPGNNSPRFDEALAVATANGSRYGWVSTVVMIEVVRTSSPNRDLEVGGRFDQRVSEALAEVLRVGDAAGRSGSSRFVALLSNARTDEARAFLGRLRRALGSEFGDFPILIGAACTPDDSVDPEELLRLAGERLT